MTDDPGEGFLHFFQHESSRSLVQLVLQIMYIPAKYLQALVDNCTNIQVRPPGPGRSAFTTGFESLRLKNSCITCAIERN
jgi:hypothetical protein